MQDAGIIRNRLKIEAAIHNAKTIKTIQKETGSFKNWLDKHHPKTKEEWVKLFKQTFRFTGGEIVNEFLPEKKNNSKFCTFEIDKEKFTYSKEYSK